MDTPNWDTVAVVPIAPTGGCWIAWYTNTDDGRKVGRSAEMALMQRSGAATRVVFGVVVKDTAELVAADELPGFDSVKWQPAADY